VTTAMSVPQMVTGQDRMQPTLFAMQVTLAAGMKAYRVRPRRAGELLHHNAALSFQ
jgi:polyketide synthase 5